MSSGGKSSGFLPVRLVQAVLDSLGDNANYHVSARSFITTFVVFNFLFLLISPSQTLKNYEFLLFTAPLWMPYILLEFGVIQFIQAKRAEAIAGTKTVLLELRMPRDTQKTPLAMETIFANLHLTSGEGNWYKKYIKGGVRPWHSFEIVSIGGRVHFYVWVREGLRRGLESFFYAQYPNMEIIEVEDYSRLIDPSSDGYSMWGDEFIHTKKDPYPIKTYVEFGLDKPGTKPEEQIDPLNQVIELLGSIGPKEQIWLQFVIRASKDEKYAGRKGSDGKAYTWQNEARDIIEEIREKTQREGKYIDPVTGKEQKTTGFPNPTKGQSDTMAALERNIGKQGFDVGIRILYTAPKDAYQGGMVSFIVPILKPFHSESLNGFKPSAHFLAQFQDYPWEDPGGKYKKYLEHKLVDVYRRRAFFHAPYVGEWMIMSTEELATLFHVPSSTIQTPNLPRIQSSTSGAPSNLPI